VTISPRRANLVRFELLQKGGAGRAAVEGEDSMTTASAYEASSGGVGTPQTGPKVSWILLKKVWRVGIIYFKGEKRRMACTLLALVLSLCGVCAGKYDLQSLCDFPYYGERNLSV
jgi:hypothetical protein